MNPLSIDHIYLSQYETEPWCQLCKFFGTSTRGEIVLESDTGRPIGSATGATKLRASPMARGAPRVPATRWGPRLLRFTACGATGTAGLVWAVRGCAGCTGRLGSSGAGGLPSSAPNHILVKSFALKICWVGVGLGVHSCLTWFLSDYPSPCGPFTKSSPVQVLPKLPTAPRIYFVVQRSLVLKVLDSSPRCNTRSFIIKSLHTLMSPFFPAIFPRAEPRIAADTTIQGPVHGTQWGLPVSLGCNAVVTAGWWWDASNEQTQTVGLTRQNGQMSPVATSFFLPHPY